jgi:hypothetical protein
MKKYLLLPVFSLIIFSQFSTGQDQQTNTKLTIIESKFDISAGMGLKVISASDIVNYINSFVPTERENDVTIAPEFYICPEYQIMDELSLKLDYSYIIKSYNKEVPYGQMSLTYAIHSPSLVLHYLLKGEGYVVKIGGGVGYHFGNLSQKFITSLESNYHTNGIGIKIDLAGHTMMGKNLFAAIGANLQADFMGEFKDSNGKTIPVKQKITLGFIGAGLNFGLAYYF